MPESIDRALWRRAFPVLGEVIHLNHAARGPLSGPARRAMEEVIRDANEASPRRFVLRHEQCVDATRRDVARLLGARPAEVGFVANTAQGISILANGLAWRPGDNVCIPEGDYPANVYPWMNLAPRGVEVRFAPTRLGEIPLDELARRMDGRTRVVSVSAVEFRHGFRHDVAALAELCRARGAILCLDAIQMLGAAPLDVAALGIDFLAAGGFKWLLGPLGSGIIYCSEGSLDRVRPPNVGAESVANAGDYLAYDLTPAPGARRFEEGTLGEIAIIGLGASVRMLLDVGLHAIEGAIAGLLDRAREGLARRGFRILTHPDHRRRAGILSFACRREEAWYRRRFVQAGIVATVRYGEVRISPHFYVTEEEIDAFLEALEGDA